MAEETVAVLANATVKSIEYSWENVDKSGKDFHILKSALEK